MEPKRRRQLAVSILALGVVALVVDQAILQPGDSGPSLASAGSVVEVASATPENAAPRVERESLAARLRQVAGEMEGARHDPGFVGPPAPADVFAGPVAWRVTAPVLAAAVEAETKPPTDPSMPEIRLTAVMGTDAAVINGKLTRAGDSFEVVSENKMKHAVTLVSVDASERRAVVRLNGREMTVSVAASARTPR